jgi:hypothetical protein
VGELDHLLDVVTMRNHTHSRFVLALILLMLTIVDAEPASQSTAVASIQDLRGVSELRTMFNRDAGKLRLVLLLSPT